MTKRNLKPRGVVKAVSYSRYALHKECPAKFKYKNLDKLPEEQGPALARGSRIHNLGEDYAMARVAKMPEELKLYKKEFDELRAYGEDGIGEMMWQLDRGWEYVKDKWSPSIYVRIKTDFSAVLPNGTVRVIDYKTGKVNPKKVAEYDEQMTLYAAGAVAVYEDVKTVGTELWFLDHAVTREKAFTAAEARSLQKAWDKKFTPLLNETAFQPTPGEHCRWCSFSRSKGGPCRY